MRKVVATKPPPARRCTPCRICGACACCLFLVVAVAALVFYFHFKMPQVDLIAATPGRIQASLATLQMSAHLKLLFRVQNANVVGLTLSKVEGTGFVPTSPIPVAFGRLNNVSIASKSDTHIEFPVTVSYNPNADNDLAIAHYISRRCQVDDKVSVTVIVKFYIFPLSTFGIVPKTDRTILIRCRDIDRVVDTVQRRVAG